mgnify:FL=1
MKMCMKLIVCYADVHYVNSQSVAGCQVMAGQKQGRTLLQGFKDTNPETERLTMNNNKNSLSEKSLCQLHYGLQMLQLKRYCKRFTIY